MCKGYNYRNIIEIMIMIAISLIPLAITPGYDDVTQLIKLIYLQIILVIIVILWFFNEKDKLKLLAINTKINILFGLYILLLIIATMNAYKISYSLFGYYKRWEGIFTIAAYLLFAIYSNLYFNLNHKKMNFALVTASIISIYGILQYYGLYYFGFLEIAGVDNPVFSTIGNPNSLGSYLILFIPVAMYLFMETKKKIYIVPFSIMYLCLLMTETRSAWLGIIASITFIIYFSFKHNQSKKEILQLLIIIIFITIIFDISNGGLFIKRFITIIQDIFTIVKKEPNYNRTGSSRIFIWERVLKLIAKKPFFGYGLDNLALIFDKYFREDIINVLGKMVWIDKAHNQYLHICVSSGIPSLIVYLSFNFSILKESYKRIYKNLDTLPIYAGVIGYLVQGFFNISVVSVAYLYWIYLGILMKKKELNSPRKD